MIITIQCDWDTQIAHIELKRIMPPTYCLQTWRFQIPRNSKKNFALCNFINQKATRQEYKQGKVWCYFNDDKHENRIFNR